MKSRIKVVSQTNGKQFERECEVLHRDHKILIASPIPDKYNELFIFFAYGNSNGFNVVLPGESIGVNFFRVDNIPVASGRYKLAIDGGASIEINHVNCAATHKEMIRNFERKGLGDKRDGKKSKKN